MKYAYITMNDKASYYPSGDPMSRFQQLTRSIVDKYCSMPLPYRPGLYSIHWESSYRISGLLDELNTSAKLAFKEMSGKHSTDVSKTREELHDLIHKALLHYIEKIYGVDYADTEQPQWMIEIARRLQANAHLSF